MDIVNQILSWPLIIQGALGSALFWFILVLGQFFSRKGKHYFGEHKQEIGARDEMIMNALRTESSEELNSFFQMALYSALHYSLKGIIFLVLGLLLNSYIPVFSIVGFVGAIIYLFLALRSCPNLDPFFDKCIAELKDKINANK